MAFEPRVVLGVFFSFAATALLLFVCVASTVAGGSRNQHNSHATGQLGSIQNLTYGLIFHPIAAGLSGLAVLFGISSALFHRKGPILMALFSSLATLFTFLAFVLDLALFIIARNEFLKSGWSAQYGNAMWLTMGALAVLALGFYFSTLDVVRSYNGIPVSSSKRTGRIGMFCI
ncbi:hypothetical protein BC826DRAFT_984895 [Russula brevipes]|nr:hypothetical protein BC826DRAFT_984895 [Russula brevipes]